MKTKETAIYDRHSMKWRNNQVRAFTSLFCALIEFFRGFTWCVIRKKINMFTHSILLLIVSSNIKYFVWVSNMYCNNYCMQCCKSEIMTYFDRVKLCIDDNIQKARAKWKETCVSSSNKYSKQPYYVDYSSTKYLQFWTTTELWPQWIK